MARTRRREGRFQPPSVRPAATPRGYGPAVAAITADRVRVGGVDTFVRRTDGAGTPAVFLHGNPTTSDDWIPFLEALEGPALAPDLPAFGRSERPSPRRFDSSMRAYGEWVGALLDAEGIE